MVLNQYDWLQETHLDYRWGTVCMETISMKLPLQLKLAWDGLQNSQSHLPTIMRFRNKRLMESLGNLLVFSLKIVEFQGSPTLL